MHFECGHGTKDRHSMKRIDSKLIELVGMIRTYECPECGCRVNHFPKLKKIVVWQGEVV